MKVSNNFEKMNISLRYWLIGMAHSDPNYYKCLEAMEFAASYHTGVRKDGVTREIEHQITIALYIKTLIKYLLYPWETICVALLHDVCEDYGVPYEVIRDKFGVIVAQGVEAMTKVYKGVKKSEEHYFTGISESPTASVVKGGDRIHNLQTMVGVFTIPKQKEYINEAVTNIVPAIKNARRRFWEQEAAYENIKLIMYSQIQLIEKTIENEEILVNERN